MYERLPKELIQSGKFCLWRYEVRKGKRTKVPYRTDGKCADSTNAADFSSFDTVTAVLAHGGYDGIGIMVESNFSAIDIDDCVTAGVLSPLAQDIVDTMDSYTETSPSGKGIRIIFDAGDTAYDVKRFYINNTKNHTEVYAAGYTSKYVTITGNSILDRGIEPRGEQMLAVAEKYMLRKTANNPTVTPPGSFLSDESVIAKASTAVNGEKFRKLHGGDRSDYKTGSEADLAYFAILAFWCGGDTEQMMRIAGESELYRAKWDRTDYLEGTVRKAVDGCTEFYKPIMTGSAETDFNNIADTLRELNIIGNDRYSETDIGSGRLFADVFKGIARFTEDRKRWMVYDGERWVADTAGLRITELGKDLSDAMLIYAASLHDEDQRTRMLKWCKKWVQRRFRDIYIREAQSVYPVNMLIFDSDPLLFNCKNCTIDLKSRTAHEHCPEDFITRMSPVVYDPDARSPRWERFIDEIMSGDRDKAGYLQKTLGYGLTGDTNYECLFIYYGETTRNGKGTLVESVLPVMGDYGITVRPETITQKTKTDSHAPTEDIARLAGIRFANISEPSRGMLLNAAQLKSMTGNDTLNARFLNENSFDFKSQFKLYINTNYLPVINDMTIFSSNRVIIVPFDRHFTDAEQDKGLKREFIKPEVQSAILNWLLEGYRLLGAEGFSKPDSVKDAIASYYHDSNKTEQFIEDCLTEDAASEERTSAVYDRYRNWCYENGNYTENCRNFMQELRKIGTVVRRRPQSGGEKTTLLLGYRLRETDDFLK